MVTRRGVSIFFKHIFVFVVCLKAGTSADTQTYFGPLWNGWYFVFTSLSFGWKAGAFLCLSIGLSATSGYIRPHGVSFSQYINDWHLTQSSPNSIFRSPLFVVWLPACEGSSLFYLLHYDWPPLLHCVLTGALITSICHGLSKNYVFDVLDLDL